MAAAVAAMRIGTNPKRSPNTAPRIDAGTPPRLPIEMAKAISVGSSPALDAMRSEYDQNVVAAIWNAITLTSRPAPANRPAPSDRGGAASLTTGDGAFT